MLSPIIGLSLRGALTRRVTVQVGEMPIPGETGAFFEVRFTGTVGRRGVYKFLTGSWYNVFAGRGVVATVFEVREEKDVDGRLIDREGRVDRVGWTGYLTVGVEAVFWSRLSLSLEVGGARRGAIPTFTCRASSVEALLLVSGLGDSVSGALV